MPELPEGEHKDHHGREYAVAFVSIIGEYLAVRYSITWLAWLAAFFLWLALIGYTRKYFRSSAWLKYGFRCVLAITIAMATYRLTNNKTFSNVDAQQREPKKPDVQQSSQGANSPNTNITGNNNTVTINPPHNAPHLTSPTFHEKVETVTFSLGEHGFITGIAMEALKRGPVKPIKFNDAEPVTLMLKGDKLLVDFKVWNGNDKPPIEVHNNEFTVRIPGCDKNSNASALEIINADGVVLFQLIRKTPTDVVVNGIFPSPTGGWIIAGPQGARFDQNPTAVLLKPIFKYPAWKYPGQYAE